MQTKIKVGQKVYLRSSGLSWNKFGIAEATVTKVGKKYFETDHNGRDRVVIETLDQDGRGYSSQYKVYLTRQEIEDEDETNKLRGILRKVFDYPQSEITLDQLRRVHAIVKETVNG